MCQSRQSLLIVHWVHERILTSNFHWLVPKKLHKKPVSLLSQAARGPGAYRDRSCHKKSQRHAVLGLHNSFIDCPTIRKFCLTMSITIGTQVMYQKLTKSTVFSGGTSHHWAKMCKMAYFESFHTNIERRQSGVTVSLLNWSIGVKEHMSKQLASKDTSKQCKHMSKQATITV